MFFAAEQSYLLNHHIELLRNIEPPAMYISKINYENTTENQRKLLKKIQANFKIRMIKDDIFLILKK